MFMFKLNSTRLIGARGLVFFNFIPRYWNIEYVRGFLREEIQIQVKDKCLLDATKPMPMMFLGTKPRIDWVRAIVSEGGGTFTEAFVKMIEATILARIINSENWLQRHGKDPLLHSDHLITKQIILHTKQVI